MNADTFYNCKSNDGITYLTTDDTGVGSRADIRRVTVATLSREVHVGKPLAGSL
jgi:hypothetical protein